MKRLFLRVAVALALLAGTLAHSRLAFAQSSEMEAVLFVQSAPSSVYKDGIDLVWLPQPLQRVCLGKTEQQCAAIDFCIRTTNPDAAMCRNLGIPRSRLPSYPPGMTPRRQLSISFFAIDPATSPVKKIAMLQDFFRGVPKPSLERLSMSARVRARIQFIRKADDDDFNVLEILAVAPF